MGDIQRSCACYHAFGLPHHQLVRPFVALASRLRSEGHDPVFGLIAAGNRDPAQIKAPEVFDVTREQVPSPTFGAGPHYCLGAYLAGMQGEILFPPLLRRFPRMRPAGDPAYWTPGSTLRGLDRLPLTLS